MGVDVVLLPAFWEKQFTWVMQSTFKGLSCLASVYAAHSALTPALVAQYCMPQTAM
jgi:hypothetical protein